VYIHIDTSSGLWTQDACVTISPTAGAVAVCSYNYYNSNMKGRQQQQQQRLQGDLVGGKGGGYWVAGGVVEWRLADNCLTLGSCFICPAHVDQPTPPAGPLIWPGQVRQTEVRRWAEKWAGRQTSQN